MSIHGKFLRGVVLGVALGASPALTMAQGVPMSVAPDYNRSYADYQKEYAQQEIVAPGMGVNASSEPNIFQRMGGAIASGASTVTGGVKSLWNSAASKVSGAFADDKPENTADHDPIALGHGAKEPSATLHVSLARMQEGNRNEAGAIEQYEKALKMEPKNVEALLGLARLHDRAGRFEKAEELYQQAVQVRPEDASAWNDMGLCHARQGHLKPAAIALQGAVQLAPDKALYRNNLATVFVELGEVDEAVAQLKAVHPPAIAHYNTGYLLNKRGKPQLALEQFRLAAAADPSLVAARQWVEALSAETLAASGELNTHHGDRVIPQSPAPQQPQQTAEPRYSTTPASNPLPTLPDISTVGPRYAQPTQRVAALPEQPGATAQQPAAQSTTTTTQPANIQSQPQQQQPYYPRSRY